MLPPLRFAPLVLVAAVGCASVGRHPGAERLETAAVIVDEPPAPVGGPAVNDVVPDEEPHSDLLLGAARLVANDGRLGHDALAGLDRWSVGWCGRGLFRPAVAAVRTPLEERGVYGTLDPVRASRSWVLVGLTFGDDVVSPWLASAPCRGAWVDARAPEARIGLLPAELTGRDTSLLFTTARARQVGHGQPPALVGAAIGALVGSHGTDGRADEPRTAQPRPASSPAPAPAATAPATRDDGSAGERSAGAPARPAPSRRTAPRLP